MKTDNATARPWKIVKASEDESLSILPIIRDSKDAAIASLIGTFEQGELIVKAVNNFDGMLEALRHVTQQYNFDELGPGCKLLVNQAITNAEKDT